MAPELTPSKVLVIVSPPVPVIELLTVRLALFWLRMPSLLPKSTVPPVIVSVSLPIDMMAPAATPRVKPFWVIVGLTLLVVPADMIAPTTLLLVSVSLANSLTTSVGPAAAIEVL